MLRAELHVVHLRTAVRHAEQVLAPALGPSDGTPDLVREPGDHELFRVHAALGAEAATDPRRAHAHVRGVESERARNVGLDTEHRLRRCPHGERSIGFGDRHAAVRLHRDGRHPLVLHERPHDDVGVGEEVVVGLARERTDEVGAVRRKEQGRALGGGRDRIGDRGERVDLHRDFLGGVERLGERVGEHDGHRLPDEAHPVDRQQRPPERFVTRERALAGKVEIGGGPDRVHAVALRLPAAVWTASTTPWATWDRTNTAWSAPSISRSAMKRALPVSRPGSSERSTGMTENRPRPAETISNSPLAASGQSNVRRVRRRDDLLRGR